MNLVPLRIPGGWLVIKNTFYDVSPEVVNGRLSPPGVFVQDILSIERRLFDGNAPPELDFVIDLGWLPDEDPNGGYHLTLLRESWEHVIGTIESRDRSVIRDTLERWLELGAAATRPEDLVKALRQR